MPVEMNQEKNVPTLFRAKFSVTLPQHIRFVGQEVQFWFDWFLLKKFERLAQILLQHIVTKIAHLSLQQSEVLRTLCAFQGI